MKASNVYFGPDPDIHIYFKNGKSYPGKFMNIYRLYELHLVPDQGWK